jgi:hypothetical protein
MEGIIMRVRRLMQPAPRACNLVAYLCYFKVTVIILQLEKKERVITSQYWQLFLFLHSQKTILFLNSFHHVQEFFMHTNKGSFLDNILEYAHYFNAWRCKALMLLTDYSRYT